MFELISSLSTTRLSQRLLFDDIFMGSASNERRGVLSHINITFTVKDQYVVVVVVGRTCHDRKQ